MIKVKPNVKLSKHANERINERIDRTCSINYALLGSKEKKQMVKNARVNGISVGKYNQRDRKSQFKRYLNTKVCEDKRILLYQKHLFVFTRDMRLVITVYPIPKIYHHTYDKYIREGTNTDFLLYLKDRNTKSLKPAFYFCNLAKAQNFIIKVFKNKYYPNFLKTTKYSKHDEKAFLKYLKDKKIYKIEEVIARSDYEIERNKEMVKKFLEKIY